jgi:hypothetical protein
LKYACARFMASGESFFASSNILSKS